MRWQQKSIELFVVPCQALVLLLFNTTASSSIGFQQIQDATQLDTGLLKRVLHSLSCAAIKILTKVSETDQFCFNDSLQCSSHKVRVPMATVNVGTEAAEKTVQIERIYTLDAAIVRIMKARKKVSHVALMTVRTCDVCMRKHINKTIGTGRVQRIVSANAKADQATYRRFDQ